MSKSILFVIDSFNVGGTEKHLSQILPILRSRGLNVAVFTIGKKGHLGAQIEKFGLQVYEPTVFDIVTELPISLQRFLFIPFAFVRLSKLLLTKDIALLHFFLPRAYLIGGLTSLLMRTPIRIMSRRSLNCYQTGRYFTKRLELWLHQFMHAVIGNSNAVVSNLYDEGIEKSKVGLIYNGLDIKAFSGLRDKYLLRLDFGVSPETFLVIMVANFFPYKGHRDLVEAFGLIADQMPSGWALWLVGRDQGCVSDVLSYADKLGIAENVKCLGQIDNVANYLLSADVGVLCSHEEGFSNSVLEYMAAGLPVVASDVGGNKEAVVHGVTGFVVPPRDSQRLGEKILLLAKQKKLRKQMGKAGQAYVKKTFTLDRCVSDYEKLYNGLLLNENDTIQNIIDKRQLRN